MVNEKLELLLKLFKKQHKILHIIFNMINEYNNTDSDNDSDDNDSDDNDSDDDVKNFKRLERKLNLN